MNGGDKCMICGENSTSCMVRINRNVMTILLLRLQSAKNACSKSGKKHYLINPPNLCEHIVNICEQAIHSEKI